MTIPWRFLLPLLAGSLAGGCTSSKTPGPPLPDPAPATTAPLAASTAEPTGTPAAKTSVRFTRSDYDSHIAELRKRFPLDRFHVFVQPPFVVVGDESEQRVRRRADHVVSWAVTLLKKDFFSQDPEHILTIWLFANDVSYRAHAQSFFGEEPSTPYGYYSARNNALVMNIATGGGTLVHEIVHPFMEANFPACPAWFNEGLGSLYEASREHEGHIWGLTNWRLPALQQAIREGRLPPFERLFAMTDDQFYGEDSGTNYAQARYLCYFLQEKGWLVTFYRAFVAGHAVDPTGVNTLRRVLGTTDLVAFQKQWEAFVLGLRFPDPPLD
jgi:hypothetical protein